MDKTLKRQRKNKDADEIIRLSSTQDACGDIGLGPAKTFVSWKKEEKKKGRASKHRCSLEQLSPTFLAPRTHWSAYENLMPDI